MKWIEYSLARSIVADWIVTHNSKKNIKFRLKEICDYEGRENDSSVDKGYLDPIRKDDLLNIRVGHKILADLVERGLLDVDIGKYNVEIYTVRGIMDVAVWQKMIGSRGKWSHRIIMTWRSLKRRLWILTSWIATVFAATFLRDVFFS